MYIKGNSERKRQVPSNTGRGMYMYLAPPGKKDFFFFLSSNNLALSGYLSGFGCFLENHTEDFNRWA